MSDKATLKERIEQYPQVAQAQETAASYYASAKDSNQMIRNTLGAAETGISTATSYLWPYVGPTLEKLEPVAINQLDYVEKKVPELSEFAHKKYDEYSGTVTGAYAAGHDKAAAMLANASSNVDYYLPAEGEADEHLAAEKSAQETSLRGEVYLVSDKIRHRLYARAAKNVSNAYEYTISLRSGGEANLQKYLEVIDIQRGNLQTSLASTQAYVLSYLKENSETARVKLDELRATASKQTAMDMIHSLNEFLTSVKETAAAKASSYKIPEAVVERVNTLTTKVQVFYEEVRAGDDKLDVMKTLNAYAEDANKSWDLLKQSLNQYVTANPSEKKIQ